MKKALLHSIPLILAWMLCAGLALAADSNAAVPAPAVKPAPVCAAQETAPEPVVQLFVPQPQPAAICPLIGCANDEFCRRDRDCVAAPGGVCNLFCPTRGCCSYPS
jgi:hypothetical protein